MLPVWVSKKDAKLSFMENLVENAHQAVQEGLQVTFDLGRMEQDIKKVKAELDSNREHLVFSLSALYFYIRAFLMAIWSPAHARMRTHIQISPSGARDAAPERAWPLPPLPGSEPPIPSLPPATSATATTSATFTVILTTRTCTARATPTSVTSLSSRTPTFLLCWI